MAILAAAVWLLAAPAAQADHEERRRAEDMVRTTSKLWAEFIRGGKPPPGWRAMRDAHCQATAAQ